MLFFPCPSQIVITLSPPILYTWKVVFFLQCSHFHLNPSVEVSVQRVSSACCHLKENRLGWICWEHPFTALHQASGSITQARGASITASGRRSGRNALSSVPLWCAGWHRYLYGQLQGLQNPLSSAVSVCLLILGHWSTILPFLGCPKLWLLLTADFCEDLSNRWNKTSTFWIQGEGIFSL